MSLVKRDNSKNWYYVFQINGKRYFGSTGTPKKTLATKIEDKKREQAVSSQVFGQVETITLQDALDLYRQSKEGTPDYQNAVSYGNKLLGFKINPRTGKRIETNGLASPDTLIHEITTKDVVRLMTVRKGDKAATWTIKHEIRYLRAAIKHAHDRGFKTNPDINWPMKELKTKRGRLRYLTIEEENRLLAELDPNRNGKGLLALDKRAEKLASQMQANYDFVVALLDTGMRYSELANLPWSAVDLDTDTIRIYRKKVANADTFHMTDRLKAVLERRYRDRSAKSRYVFESSEGKPRGYTSHAISKAMDRAGLNDLEVIKETGGKATIHTLRHTFASRLVQAGVSLAKVSKLLGHASVTTTEIYAHLAPNEVSVEAVSVLNRLNSGND